MASANQAFARGELDDAERWLDEALQAVPDDALAHNLLGMVLRAKGQPAAAEASFRKALQLNPRLADAYGNLGTVLTDAGRAAEAEDAFRAALAEQPSHTVALCNLGVLLAERGAHAEAEQSFRKALQAEPGYFHARLSLLVNQLREVYDDEAHLSAARADYQAALADLRDWAAQREVPKSAADAVGWITPFLLAYQGRNDRELQSAYGTLICDLMARRHPELAAAPPRAIRTGERLRVGFASGFFHDHSVWKNPIRGWIENLDRSRFDIYGYYTGHRRDADTAAARKACTRFVDDLSFEPLAQAIRNDGLHALIFPEIGMDPTTVKLAALRLAPVQCTSWGHPTTSGMPTIDYFLSSELMEPPHGDDHYTEKLVRLPNLSVHYTPALYPPRPLERRELGLDEGSVVFFCAQSLMKYLPQYDALFPRIARQVPNGQFLFISAHRSARITERFMQRLGNAFRREGLDPARHVVMLPRMDGATFQAVARLGDIFLDSIGWSGCNSSLESMANGLPAITCAGSTMRARHTYALLKLMQLDELIADGVDSYVELAVRLARDEPWRAEMRELMKLRLPGLYGDLQCVRALEDFLVRAATGL